MASTITLTGDWLVSFGNLRQTSGTGNLGTYATNGVAVSASQVGLGVISSMIINPAGGYTFEYVPSTGKVKAYYSATPTGTISGSAAGQVFAGSALATHTHDMKVIGGQGAAGTDTVTAPAGTDILGKQEAGDADILGADVATKGGVVAITAGTPAGTNASSAITATFTGTGTAALAEVTNSANLAGVTFTFVAQGY